MSVNVARATIDIYTCESSLTKEAPNPTNASQEEAFTPCSSVVRIIRNAIRGNISGWTCQTKVRKSGRIRIDLEESDP